VRVTLSVNDAPQKRCLFSFRPSQQRSTVNVLHQLTRGKGFDQTLLETMVAPLKHDQVRRIEFIQGKKPWWNFILPTRNGTKTCFYLGFNRKISNFQSQGVMFPPIFNNAARQNKRVR